MDAKQIMKIFEDTAYVRMGGSPEELRCAQYLQEKVAEMGMTQSMSKRGNCWDNAPQESFFGHMKDELASEIRGWTSFEDVKTSIGRWMDYYNNDRYQWDLLKLSPKEYYKYTQTGIYPLEKLRYEKWGSAPNPEV